MIVTLAKLALLLVSYLGWWEFFRGRCRVNVYFAPVLTLAVHFTVMFLPGLLNFLPEAVWALYLGGFVLLWDGFRREKLGFVKHYVNFGYLLLFAALAVMAVAFRGKVVTWFDNFTHWAVAVKNMLAADRFPTFAQAAVTFNTYPLGSTALIYYFARFTSSEEDFWMLAQGFALLCCLLPMFAFGKENSLLKAVFLGLLANFLLCYNIPLTELLVDTLLPLAGTAMLLLVYRECLEREQPLEVWFAFPAMFWVMNIKNAGLLFAITGAAFLLWRLRKQPQTVKKLALLCLALAAGYILWHRHCDYVFYQDTFSQHEISVDYFSSRLGEKTPRDAWQITCSLARAMVLRGETGCLLAAVCLLGLLTRWLRPEQIKIFGKLAAFLVAAFLVYGISLLVMYVFTMSREGALELQSADRYICIWEIMAWYLLGVYAVDLTDHVPKNRLMSLGLAAAMGAFWLCYYGGAQTFAAPGRNDPAARLRYEAPIWEYGIEPGRSYLICAEDDVLWYPAFLWGYHLDSDRYLQMKVTEESQMAAEKHYDYVVILDEDNPVIEAWVEKTYPDQLGRTVIQCFK